ncbi:hypothetical protein ACU8L2_23655 [Rhizobium leguminosarum]
MLNRQYHSLCLSLGMLSFFGLVNAAAEDSCRSVYQNAVRDIAIETKTYQELDYVYDNYCERDGTKRNINIDTTVKVLFDEIPFGLTSNKGATEERQREFCRLYSSQRYVFGRYVSYKNDVQVAALQQFNQCLDMETRGLAFASSQVGLSDGTISATFRNRTTALVVNAVVYDDKLLACSISSDDLKNPPDLAERKAFAVKTNFTVSCKRVVQNENGRSYYPPADVRLETNEGGYSAHFEGDALNGFYLASDAQKRFDEATKAREVAEKNVETLVSNIDSANVRTYRFYNGDPGGDAPMTGPRLNCGDVNAHAAKLCGNGKVFIKNLLGRSQPGGRCGYDWYTVACLDIDKTLPPPASNNLTLPFYVPFQMAN